MNEDEDDAMTQNGERGTGSAERARQAQEHWNKYAGEFHPNLLGKTPGTGYAKNVPDDVRTAQELVKEQGRTR